MTAPIDRRRFLKQSAVLGAGLAGLSLSADAPPARPAGQAAAPVAAPFVGPRLLYPDNKPRVILIRFGGGVRRQETIAAAESTYCPFIYHELYQRRGILLNNVEIENDPKIVTSHGEGTLYLLTGKYEAVHDVTNRFLGNRYVPQVPTITEYLRRAWDVAEHEALIINGEDRIDEDFFTYSNCPHFGVHYRSTVLSLHRFKSFLLRDELAHGRWLPGGRRAALTDEERQQRQRDLAQREAQERQSPPGAADQATPAMNAFWDRWRGYYGTNGFVNPRGDRLLTTLSLWALRELRPKLLMINYQDPDYVHWGNRSFYTRAISVIDEGVREIHQATQADPEYRDNTVFLVVPDCGRDSNRAMPIPYQHHFNTRSAREIFAVASGPGIRRDTTPVDRKRQQASVAATIGRVMGFRTPWADGAAGTLEEVFA